MLRLDVDRGWDTGGLGLECFHRLLCGPTIRTPQNKPQIPRKRIAQLEYKATRNTASSRSRHRRCADQGQSSPAPAWRSLRASHAKHHVMWPTLSDGASPNRGYLWTTPNARKTSSPSRVQFLPKNSRLPSGSQGQRDKGNKEGVNPPGLYTALI